RAAAAAAHVDVGAARHARRGAVEGHAPAAAHRRNDAGRDADPAPRRADDRPRSARAAGAARPLRQPDARRDVPPDRAVSQNPTLALPQTSWGRVSALVWLDWRLLVNRIRTIARSPRRLIPWVIFLVWLVPSFLTRLTFGGRIRNDPALPALIPQLAPLGVLVPGIALAVLGISVWRASLNAPAAFQSPADARFVIGAGLDSRAVFTWLSLRTARRLITSFALMLVLIQVLYL